MKNFIITILVLLLLGLGAYYLFSNPSANVSPNGETPENGQVTEEEVVENEPETVIGTSADGNTITAYHYGTGSSEILFVGGIHGGYSWNTTLVAFELMYYLEANPEAVPENIKVTVVPVLNPDGLEKVVDTTGRFSASDVSSSQEVRVSGRFNGNNVDVNRNFDCQWQSDALWQTRRVDGGDAPFSEPESQAIRDYINSNNIEAAVVWYSAAGGVYSSNCGSDPISPETKLITELYADASGYPAYEDFDFYPTTGDMVNWMAKQGIPAISVLLTNHQDVEWDENKLGLEALLDHYSQ